MLVLNVTYHVKPGKRQKFYDAIREKGIDEASRKDKGNILYDYSYDPENEDNLLLEEIWEDAETQKLHCDTPHFAVLTGLKEEFVENTEIRRFE